MLVSINQPCTGSVRQKLEGLSPFKLQVWKILLLRTEPNANSDTKIIASFMTAMV